MDNHNERITKSYYDDDDVQLGLLHLVVTWAVRAAMGRLPRLTIITIINMIIITNMMNIITTIINDSSSTT